MKINPINKVPFKEIVETFRRETITSWQDGINPEVVNASYDTFEYVRKEEDDTKDGKGLEGR